MAEEAAPPASKPEPAAPVKKSKKTILMIAGILIVEAVAIVGVMKFVLAGHAVPVAAADAGHAEDSEQDKLVETLVLNAKMANNKSGVTYLYATEIYVQVKQKHVDQVKAEIEQFQNEIKADVTAIWRTAEPQHFQEPKLENLTRKVYALLDGRFGMDSTDKEHSEPIVSKVVIVMSTGFRVDT